MPTISVLFRITFAAFLYTTAISFSDAVEINIESLPKVAKTISIWGSCGRRQIDGGVVGLEGVVFVKKDGELWSFRPVDPQISLFAVVVDLRGAIVAVGGRRSSAKQLVSDAVILRSTDEGRSFCEVWSAPGGALLEIVKSTDGAFVVAGANGVVLRSSGGEQWVSIRTEESIKLWAVHFHDSDVGLVGGGETSWQDGGKASGVILRTTDGGKSYRRVFTGKNRISIFSFVDKMNGFAAGVAGSLLVTHDGGMTWQERKIDGWDSIVNAIWFINPRCGVAVGGSRMGRVTKDGGESWPVSLSLAKDDTFVESISAGADGQLWISYGHGAVGRIKLRGRGLCGEVAFTFLRDSSPL